MTNDDMEQLMARLTPKGVAPELRPQVLAAVASELAGGEVKSGGIASGVGSATATAVQKSASPWLRRCTWAVAASLLVGIALNVWANTLADRRLAELTAARPSSGGYEDFSKYMATVRQLIDELQMASKDSYHETSQEDSSMDRDRARRTGGNRTGCQRRLCLDYRFTA